MGASRLAESLAQYASLTEPEQSALAGLEEQQRTFRRGAIVIAEEERPRELFVVQEGWLHSSASLGSGARQILRIHFPGQLLGIPLLAFPASPESVTAVTDVRLAGFSRERLASAMAAHPRLSAMILAQAIAERVRLADRLASVGRTPARARVAALLCELFDHLGDGGGENVQIPLTQEEIGDATGLTAVHVNRMLRRLAQDEVIARDGNRVRVLDRARLVAEAGYVDRGRLTLDWMPRAAG